MLQVCGCNKIPNQQKVSKQSKATKQKPLDMHIFIIINSKQKKKNKQTQVAGASTSKQQLISLLCKIILTKS